jgi:hypothetical protein
MTRFLWRDVGLTMEEIENFFRDDWNQIEEKRERTPCWQK